MEQSDIDVLEELLKEYLDAITDMIDPNVEVFVNENQVAQGRDTILPSYQADFDTCKKVSVGVEPVVVQSNVVQVGLVAEEPVADGKTKTTSLTVRYHYNSDGRQIRHEISDIVVKSSDG